jgi:hypothetical protein
MMREDSVFCKRPENWKSQRQAETPAFFIEKFFCKKWCGIFPQKCLAELENNGNRTIHFFRQLTWQRKTKKGSFMEY